MGRKKCPEVTIRLILDAATKLFTEKGYSNTSMQDIMDATKLSKGGIYHHFASKEEIFIAIGDEICRENGMLLAKIRDSKGMNGAQKIKEIFRASIFSQNQKLMETMCPSLLDNPEFLVLQLEPIQTVTAPEFIAPILEEGNRDGSLSVPNPKACAEMIMILCNVWLNPLIFKTNGDELKEKCQIINQLLENYGIKLFDDETIEEMCLIISK